MRRTWRIIFAAGLALLVAPIVTVGLLEQREWVADGVYSAVIYAGVVLIAAWGLGELAFRFFPTKTLGLVILLAAIPLVLVPNLYINSATFLGRTAADFNTWHLLPLFAVMYQVAATAFVTVITLVVAVTMSAYRAIKRNVAA